MQLHDFNAVLYTNMSGVVVNRNGVDVGARSHSQERPRSSAFHDRRFLSRWQRPLTMAASTSPLYIRIPHCLGHHPRQMLGRVGIYFQANFTNRTCNSPIPPCACQAFLVRKFEALKRKSLCNSVCQRRVPCRNPDSVEASEQDADNADKSTRTQGLTGLRLE